jgi:ubiquinol-cytochrome c reductase cytochrome c1 subunit
MRLFALIFALLPSLALAAGGGAKLMSANTDLSDMASLQNGAKLFVNYCLNCHAAEFMRYKRMGDDLGLSEEQVKENLMFTSDKWGEPMKAALDKTAAKTFFGVVPPDLSVIARARGVDWLYTYLMSFYLDPKKPTGVNNLVFPDVGMPHVLWELQGWQVLNHETHELEPADKSDAAANQKRAEEYRKTVRDLVAYLEYMGEPAKLVRYDLGWKVLVFLFIFLIVAYLLKKEYWRDVT